MSQPRRRACRQSRQQAAQSLIRCTASFLEPLKGGKVPVEIYVRGKDADENAEQLKKCVEIIKSSGVGNSHHFI